MNGALTILRDLAARYRDLCAGEGQQARRRHWRALNSLQPVTPPIYVRAFAWAEMPEARCVCEEDALRRWESVFRSRIFHAAFDDDSTYEPWITLPASHACSGWGLAGAYRRTDSRGAFKIDYPIKALADAERLAPPRHEIDEARVRGILRRDFTALKANGCAFDVTLKDVETVQNDPRRVGRWVRVVREELARAGL